MQVQYGISLNLYAAEHKGYDAFGVNLNHYRFVLCDGANSTKISKQGAQWLSEFMAQQANDASTSVELKLRQAHEGMQIQFPESASTFIQLQVSENGLFLASVGDSFLNIYQRSYWGLGAWRCTLKMPRDCNSEGHPSQLIGSEVFEQVHFQQLPPKGVYCAVLMSDGVGLYVTDDMITERMKALGRQIPSRDDMDYLSRCLAEQALKLGSHDDVSISMVWIDFRG
jgi:serine/threonine protein phosphatase PrpC